MTAVLPELADAAAFALLELAAPPPVLKSTAEEPPTKRAKCQHACRAVTARSVEGAACVSTDEGAVTARSVEEAPSVSTAGSAADARSAEVAVLHRLVTDVVA